MSKSKKFAFLILLVALVILLPSLLYAQAKVTLTFWHIQPAGAMREALDSAVARFEKIFPNVKVESVGAAPDPYKTKLKVAMGAGAPPDVFHTWGGGWLKAFVDAGMVYDLTEDLKVGDWKETFVPAPLKLSEFNGRNYALPLEIAWVPMWYNTEMFAKYGISIPRTFDELVDICKKLKQAGVIPITLGNADKWEGAFYFIYLANRIGGEEVFIKAAAREPGYTFMDLSFIESGRKIQELVDIGAFPPGFNGMDYSAMRMLFAGEKTAMQLMGTWLPGTLKTEGPAVLGKLDYFYFPIIVSGKGDPTNVVGGTNTTFSVSAPSKNKPEAVALLRVLTSLVTAKEVVAKVGRIVAIKEALTPDIASPLLIKAANDLARARHLQLYYDQYLSPELAEVHKDTTQAIFGKTMTPEQAARAMEEAAKKLLGR